MRRLFWTFVVVGLTTSFQARSQDAGPYTHTFDMQLPPASVSSCPGPLSLAYNPAGLAWAQSFDLLFVHHQRLDVDPSAQRHFIGGADGLLLKLGGLGLGIQWVRPYDDEEKWNYLKYTLAAPLIKQQWLSIAWGLEILDPTNTNESPAVDFMLGALVRPFRYVSLGLVGRNLGRAKINDQRANRSLDLGVSVRPLWFAPEGVTLSADFRLVQDADDPPFRFTGHFSILDGISLFGSADLDGNFGAGLVVDFQRVGAGSYVNFSNKPDEIELDDVLLMARVSGDNYPGFIISKDKTAQFTLDNELISDRPFSRGWLKRHMTAFDLERAIRRATRDVRIDSILIKIEDPNLSWTNVQELQAALAEFKQAGKKVFFYLQDADNLTYYLACSADKIFMNPGGNFFVTGPTVEALFLGGTMDMIGARAEYQRVGKYKSAVEALSQEEPSQPYLDVMNSLADEYSDQLLSAMSEGRGLGRSEVEKLVDNGFMDSEEAKEAGLVDELLHFDQIDETLMNSLGHRPSRMRRYIFEKWHEDRWGGRPIIAVVHANGSIAYRDSFMSGMDARQIAKILASLRDNSDVAAVVLRVDSPGGSGSASDLIWRQVTRLRQRKPVIVSMGGVAASGGYYISAPADVIVANPATITGSIGVFALFFDLSELYAKIGISKEIVKRGQLADLGTTFRGRTEQEMELLKKKIDKFYAGFISKVAEGRKQSTEEIDKVGQGRVWTGRQAKENGLVDELGGLSKAIEIAKRKIGLKPEEEVSLAFLPRPKLSLRALLGEVGIITAEPDIIPAMLRESIQRMVELSILSAEPVLLMLPFSLNIK
jgi:protease IV